MAGSSSTGARDERPGPGPVMVIGGAEDKMKDRVILSRFVHDAGGPEARIVVISTASSLGDAATDFYRTVFGWNLRGDPNDPSFEDGTGHVIGHFMPDLPVAGEAGVRPYIYVESLDEALEKISVHGGAVVTTPYPEGDLWVATFRDPAGNVLGVWQRGPRD